MLDSLANSSNGSFLSDTVSAVERLGFSPSQLTTAAESISQLFDDIENVNGTLDHAGGYIGINTTLTSMNNVDSSFTALKNVLGFRLTATCIPAILRYVLFEPDDDSSIFEIGSIPSKNISGVTASTDRYCLSQHLFNGGADTVATDTVWTYAFPAFHKSGSCSNFFTLIYMYSLHPNWTLSTSYGDVQAFAENLTITATSGGSGTYDEVVSVWALSCALYRQEGRLNFSREANLSWTLADSYFDDVKTPVESWVSYWQASQVNGWISPPLSHVFFGEGLSQNAVQCESNEDPGQCVPYINTSTVVNNFVYASGETLRILYNTATLNASNREPGYFYKVSHSVQDQQFYQITYIPVLLLVGLVCIILAALCTTVLMLSSLQSLRWRAFHRVDAIRLVVDSVDGAIRGEDKMMFSRLGALSLSDSELERWATGYQVAYVRAADVDDPSHTQAYALRLIPVHKSQTASEKWSGALELDELQLRHPEN